MVDKGKDYIWNEEYSDIKKNLFLSNHPDSLPNASSIMQNERKRSKTEITYMYRPEFVPRPK